jgi:hypothetical protein
VEVPHRTRRPPPQQPPPPPPPPIRMYLIHLKTGAWWCDATVLLMYYERVWFDEIEN